MPASALAPHQLRLTINPATLGFASTAELQDLPLPWIGQERAQAAAQFGLGLHQPDYHLFVLGEVGSGRASLLRQAMQTAAAERAVPPDLCYLHNFDTPDRPRALRLPAGQGRQLRQGMADMAKNLQADIPKRLAAADFKAEAERIEKTWQAQEGEAFAVLDAFAEARQFRLTREGGQMVFTLTGPKGQALTEAEARALPRERRAEIDAAEQELRTEIARFLEAVRPLERTRDDALAALRRQTIKPLVEHALHDIRQGLRKQIKDTVKLTHWLDQVEQAVLGDIDLFEPLDADRGSDQGTDAEDDRKDALDDLLAAPPRPWWWKTTPPSARCLAASSTARTPTPCRPTTPASTRAACSRRTAASSCCTCTTWPPKKGCGSACAASCAAGACRSRKAAAARATAPVAPWRCSPSRWMWM